MKKLSKHTFPETINVLGRTMKLFYVVDENLDPNWETDGIHLHDKNLHAKYI